MNLRQGSINSSIAAGFDLESNLSRLSAKNNHQRNLRLLDAV
jgi:hypothetical protein